MPEAVTTSTTRRRLVGLTATAAAAKIALPRPQAPAPHPDAALLAACAEFMAADAETGRLNDSDDASDDELTAAARTWDAALRAVTDTKASTPDGLRAKARVTIAAFARDVPTHLGKTVEDCALGYERVAWRLAHDILAGAQA